MVDSWELIAGLVLLVVGLIWYIRKLHAEHDEIVFAKQSQSVKYGKVSEHWAPFMKNYPFDPNNARFLGTPVDFIQFNEDKIVFVEVKTNNAKLSAREEKIKELIQSKKVDWFEFRIAEV